MGVAAILDILDGLESQMLHTKFREKDLEKKIFDWFYHIWVWRPSWTCDPDFVIKLSFPLSIDAPHKISL